MVFWRLVGNDRCLSGLWVHDRYMVMRREYILSMQATGIVDSVLTFLFEYFTSPQTSKRASLFIRLLSRRSLDVLNILKLLLISSIIYSSTKLCILGLHGGVSFSAHGAATSLSSKP
jgi:hypothetical protein